MPALRKYPDELRERAVKMVLKIRARDGEGRGEIGFALPFMIRHARPIPDRQNLTSRQPERLH
jgi:hypothetical protein